MKRMSCIYFVWDEDQVVYVGRTVGFHGRWGSHHKKYDESMMISWVEMETHEIYLAEGEYVRKLMPRDNYEVVMSRKMRSRLC